jgi:hypothetical protein
MGFILLPINFSVFYVTVLTAFVAPTQDDNNVSSIFAEVHPVAWSEKQPQFGKPFTDHLWRKRGYRLNISIIPLLNTQQTTDNSPFTLLITQSIDPQLKRLIPVFIFI